MNHVTFTEAEREAGRKLLNFFNNDPKRWTQGANERSADGYANPRGAHQPPVCWCLDGACWHIGLDNELFARAFAKALNQPYRGIYAVAEWNDYMTRTFFEVRDLLESIANGCPEPKEGT